MNIIKNIMMLLVFLIIFVSPISAQVIDSQNFAVSIPQSIRIEDIGVSEYSQTHGTPLDKEIKFNLLVNESKDGNNWELTTNEPIGVSISYNSGGAILALFASMHRYSDGYEIPKSDVRVYPSKVVFDSGPEGGDENRIFHFYPIIKVSKKTPPGNYVGTLLFTILGR